ncbi:hypothetical protein AA958_19980 [Streptomyces sp. CNQ-509]|uniref:hypothetical protein n=1 Tax=Streptomyces sp. CNQ-509 TaxID=444103 RepID=UPI00062DFB2E|nr:hypothetical protein [Streptomyces sp. CNQ-509]AKH84083.1 hypothetical protein AA958_19980 [Streptomyces sp. CNQ-509]
MRKKTRLIGAAMVGAVLLPLGASTAFAGPESAGAPAEATRDCSAPLPDDPTAATKQFLTLVGTLDDRGLTQAEIDAKLAADNCLDRVDSGGGVDTRDPDDEITLSRPEIYKVSGKNRYVARAAWKWTKIPKEVKGYDGFGLSFSKKVAPVSHVLRYRGKFMDWKTKTQAKASNSYGSGFIFNEGPRGGTGDLADMQGRIGEMGITFKAAKKGCSRHQVFSAYGHTWNSTDVTGMTIGADSFGFAWSSSSNRWDQASRASSEVKVCRS